MGRHGGGRSWGRVPNWEQGVGASEKQCDEEYDVKAGQMPSVLPLISLPLPSLYSITKWGHLPVVGTGNPHCPLHSHQPDALWKPFISACHAPPCRPFRDFRHEKTKKKRGSYLGGAIDPNATFSYKFESDDE